MHLLKAMVTVVVTLLGATAPGAALAGDLHIGVIVYENATPMDFIGPLQYFDFMFEFGTKARLSTISQSAGLLRNSPNGVPFQATQSYKSFNGTKLDVLLIGGSQDTGVVIRDAEFMAFIKAQALQADYVLSVSTGASILAATGLLDGKKATTSKRALDAASSAFPQVDWQRKARWVVDGKLWTSAGITAGMDLGQAFVTHFYNETAAVSITKTLEIISNTDPSNDPFAVKRSLTLEP